MTAEPYQKKYSGIFRSGLLLLIIIAVLTAITINTIYFSYIKSKCSPTAALKIINFNYKDVTKENYLKWRQETAPYGDSALYLYVLENIQKGKIEPLILTSTHTMVILQRPIELILVYLLAMIFNNITAFLIVNSLFYILSAVLLYRIYLLFHQDRNAAFFTGMLYCFSIITLHHGLNIMVETVPHFFFLLNIYLILKNIYFNDTVDFRNLFFLNFIIFISYLVKTNSIFICFFLFLVTVFKYKKDIKMIIIVNLYSVFIALALCIGYEYFFSIRFNFNSFQLYQHLKMERLYVNKFTLFRFIFSMGTAFNFILIPYAGYWLKKGLPEKKIAFALLITGMVTPLMAFNFFDRFVYYIFPSVYIFSAYYLFDKKFNTLRTRFFLLGGYFIFNVILLFLYRNAYVYNLVLNWLFQNKM